MDTASGLAGDGVPRRSAISSPSSPPCPMAHRPSVMVQLDDLHIGKEPRRLGREAHEEHRPMAKFGAIRPPR